MSTKASKILQVIAFALFALTLLVSIASIFAQVPIKRFYSASPEILAIRSVPFAAIAAAVIHVVLALIFMLVVFGRPSKGAVKAVGIIMAVLFVLFDAVLIPLIGVLVTNLVGRHGVNALSSYSVLSSGVSAITNILAVPATILMFIAIGALFGKDPSKEEQSGGDANG
jgi:hypothetical protein